MTEVRYSIKDLENFTGIKAHTIRIWEQRYNLFKPKRTSTNIRYYNEGDLKKILNINLLYTNGTKISKIAKLTEVDIIEQAKEIIEGRELNEAPEIEQLIRAILDFDKPKIKTILNTHSKDIYTLYAEIIIPFLNKIGELWQVNTIEIAHEHFFSNLYREFLIIKIDSLDPTDSIDKNVLLFLHEEEQHEFSILLFYYMFKSKGYNCFYMGQNLPLSNLSFTVQKINPEYIISTCIAPINDTQFQSFIDHMKEHSENSKVFISGYQTSIFKKLIPSSINVINSKKTFDKLRSSI